MKSIIIAVFSVGMVYGQIAMMSFGEKLDPAKLVGPNPDSHSVTGTLIEVGGKTFSVNIHDLPEGFFVQKVREKYRATVAEFFEDGDHRPIGEVEVSLIGGCDGDDTYESVIRRALSAKGELSTEMDASITAIEEESKKPRERHYIEEEGGIKITSKGLEQYKFVEIDGKVVWGKKPPPEPPIEFIYFGDPSIKHRSSFVHYYDDYVVSRIDIPNCYGANR